MVTLKEIALAINKKLEVAFPNIEINSMDVSEGFARPSFTVDFDNATKSPFSQIGVDRNVHVIIYFFPTKQTKKNKMELLETQEILENAFTYNLTIKDGFVVHIDELSSDKVDGILQFSFDINYIEIDFTETGENMENMEELNLNI